MNKNFILCVIDTHIFVLRLRLFRIFVCGSSLLMYYVVCLRLYILMDHYASSYATDIGEDIGMRIHDKRVYMHVVILSYRDEKY